MIRSFLTQPISLTTGATLSLASQMIALEPLAHWKRAETSPMNEAQSLFADIDRICGHFAFALHNSEPYVYATLTLVLLFVALLFPPRNDPDQA